MNHETAATDWEHLRTDESRQVENVLREHFESADAYRYNSASLRVRVVDPGFREQSREDRDDLIEPVLASFDESIQADIMNVVLLYPGETEESFRAYIMNEEFEHPGRSML